MGVGKGPTEPNIFGPGLAGSIEFIDLIIISNPNNTVTAPHYSGYV